MFSTPLSTSNSMGIGIWTGISKLLRSVATNPQVSLQHSNIAVDITLQLHVLVHLRE